MRLGWGINVFSNYFFSQTDKKGGTGVNITTMYLFLFLGNFTNANSHKFCELYSSVRTLQVRGIILQVQHSYLTIVSFQRLDHHFHQQKTTINTHAL